MAILKKTLFPTNLDKYSVLVEDTDPNSKYFKISELPETFTGGKNAFLIAGSEYLVPDTLIKIEVKDAKGNVIYHEPGEGMISSSFNSQSFVTQYYEGVSKVVAVYVYPDTSYGPCTITILGELQTYIDTNGNKSDIPANWTNTYNLKWQKQVNVNPSLSNTTKIRFYKRPTPTITELLQPIYQIVSGSKISSGIYQSFANIKLSNLETFAGDVKRVKVFRTSLGDISDYDLIQDILVESKELLTTYNLSSSVVGNTGIFSQEVLNTFWNTGSLFAQLTSSRVESGLKMSGSGLLKYSQSIDFKAGNTYELSLNAFYSGSTNNTLTAYIASGSNTSSVAILEGIPPTKNLKDSTYQFKLDSDYISGSLFFSQSNAEWHIGNLSLKLTQETAFSPDEISFVTTMPTLLGYENFNFKFEFYDINNNYVPVYVTQSANFTGGTNISNIILNISSSTSSSLGSLYAVSSSISGTMTTYSSSASSSVGYLSSSVSTSVLLLTSSISSSLSSSYGYTSGSVYTLSGSVSASTSALSSSVSRSLNSLSSSLSQSVYQSLLSSFAKVQQLADGNYSGSFISGNIIYAPVIGGQLGYFSTLFKVGQSPNSIYLDARQTPRKIFIGGVIPSGDTESSGAYNNTNTNVYLDSSGKFSLADKLTFDGAGNLSVNGSITVTGGNAATDVNALLYSQRAVVSASNAAGNAVVSGSNAAGNAVVSSSLYSANAAASASISASAAQIFATNQAISASNNTYNQSTALLQTLANGAYSGSFIGNTTIYSPNIGGQDGYISNILRVGPGGITLDGGNKAIYIGDGTYNNANTPFFFASGSAGANLFSLGTGLTWNGNTLTVNGSINITGGNAATNGSLTGSLSNKYDASNPSGFQNNSSAKTGGSVGGWAITSAEIQGGSPAGGGDGSYTTQGIRLGATGYISAKQFYVDTNGNASFSGSITGGTIAIGSNFSVSNTGIINAAGAILSGSISATGGNIGGWVVDGVILRDTNSRMKLNPTTPGLEIYDTSGNKKIDIKQGTLSDPASSGTYSVGGNGASIVFGPSGNTPTSGNSYVSTGYNTLTIATAGNYKVAASPSWSITNANYISFSGGTIYGSAYATAYLSFCTTSTYSSANVVANITIGQTDVVNNGTYSAGTYFAMNTDNSQYTVSLPATTLYVFTVIQFIGYTGASGVFGINTTTTPSSRNIVLQLDQIEITDEGMLVVAGANNYTKISRTTSSDMIVVKQDSTTKVAISAANNQGSGYAAIKTTAGDINSAGRLITLGFDTNIGSSGGFNNFAVKMYTGGPRMGELFLSTSTLRHKKDIINWEKNNILDKIKLVNPKKFRYKNWENDSELTLGLIAEDLRDNELDEAALHKYDENNIKQSDVEGIDWEKISVILWKGVQELTQRIETLENKISGSI